LLFDVQDINKVFLIIKNTGFSIIEEETVFLQFWQNGCKYFNITGADREWLEFNRLL